MSKRHRRFHVVTQVLRIRKLFTNPSSYVSLRIVAAHALRASLTRAVATGYSFFFNMNGLLQAVEAAAATVLSPDAPSIRAVPKVWNKDDMIATKQRLSGAVIKTTTGGYLFAPTKSMAGDTTPAKIFISRTGGATDYAAKALGELTTLGVAEVVLGVIAEDGQSAGLMCAGLETTLAPKDAGAGNEFTHLTITIGGGASQDVPIEEALAAVGKAWQPWEGAPGGPPPIPAAQGILSETEAGAKDMACTAITGIGPTAAIRHAVLVAMSVFTATTDTRVQVKEVVAFTVAMAGKQDRFRATLTAWASAAATTETGTAMQPASVILAAVEATAALTAALVQVIDLMSTEEVQRVTAAMDRLRQMGLSADVSHAGGYAAKELERRPHGAGGAAAAAAANTAMGAAQAAADPATGAAQAAALATIMASIGGGLSPEAAREIAIQAEASRMLDALWLTVGQGLPPMVAAARSQAIAGIADTLRTQGFDPAAAVGSAGGGGASASPIGGIGVEAGAGSSIRGAAPSRRGGTTGWGGFHAAG
jgi:hypothetical protein